jgi:hypothetical protein
MSFLAFPGVSSARRRCKRLTVCARCRTTSSRRSVSIRSTSSSGSCARARRSFARTAATATESASWASVLRPWPVSIRTRAASLAGTSTTCSPSASSRCAKALPAPLLPPTADVPPLGRNHHQVRPRAYARRQPVAAARVTLRCGNAVKGHTERITAHSTCLPPSTGTEYGVRQAWVVRLIWPAVVSSPHSGGGALPRRAATKRLSPSRVRVLSGSVFPPRAGHLTACLAGSDDFRELRGSSRAPGPTKLGRRRGVDGDRLWRAASGDRSREMDRTPRGRRPPRE